MADSRSSRLPEPLSRCPFCATPYSDQDVRAIGRRREVQITHATCQQCLRAMLFAVERHGSHIACVGALTDCDLGDALRFEKEPMITLDEVLKAHVELRG